jgi:hypothetical protein
MWPAVVAVQGIAYRMLAACWTMERDSGNASARARAGALYGGDGDQELERELRTLATAIRVGTEALPPTEPSTFACAELTALRNALKQDTAR